MKKRAVLQMVVLGLMLLVFGFGPCLAVVSSR